MNPIWMVCLVSGLSVANTAISDAKYSVQQAKPVLTVLVRDLVGIDPPVRSIAKAQAIEILNRAGVELRWINANSFEDPHFPSMMKSYVTVVIAEQAPIGWTKPDAMGFAPARTGPFPRAYVFCNLINTYLQNFTIRNNSAFGIVLGHAIVHELGHLIIPSHAHGAGIMRPNWGYREWQQAQEGSLLFAPDQARVLRQTLQSN